MTDDLIGQATTGEVPQESSPVSELVGEGKKFKTVDDLARAKIESDDFITQLQSEAEELRRELEDREQKLAGAATTQDILSRLQSREEGADAGNQSSEVSPITPDDVREILNQERTASRRMENRAATNRAISEYFKGDTKAGVEHISAELQKQGLDPEEFSRLTETSPSAALRVLGIQGQITQPQTSPTAFAGQRTPPSTGTTKRNNAYYQKLKQEMGSTKFFRDVKLQRQRHLDAKEQGDSFFEN